MRFLIFNLVVVGALFYLFHGSQSSRALNQGGVPHNVTMAAKSTVEAGRRTIATVIDKVMRQEPAAPIPSAVASPPAQTPPIEVAVREAVPPRPELTSPALATKADSARTTVPNLIPPPIDDAPAVERRRSEVLATSPAAAIKEQPKFMTPVQRRQELHALSEEMELLFASSGLR
ncbi:MAG: hypothetical protein HN956_03200 [Rhodospirillaceae bacterium]|nr:hypothetical protein [Rhodospirillaceae bacterium]